jgi:hypothetical protein
VVTGKGTAKQGSLLVAEVLLKCRSGPEFPAPATFEAIKREDVLIFVVPANDPATLPSILHRVSRR